jgi:hypothetical protein
MYSKELSTNVSCQYQRFTEKGHNPQRLHSWWNGRDQLIQDFLPEVSVFMRICGIMLPRIIFDPIGCICGDWYHERAAYSLVYRSHDENVVFEKFRKIDYELCVCDNRLTVLFASCPSLRSSGRRGWRGRCRCPTSAPSSTPPSTSTSTSASRSAEGGS